MRKQFGHQRMKNLYGSPLDIVRNGRHSIINQGPRVVAADFAGDNIVIQVVDSVVGQMNYLKR